MIDKETIDRIFSAADIVEVINDYVTLKRKGVNYQACCPFHNEKTPSFVVSPSKGVYKCFGCGKGGNAVTFVMEHEQLTYPEALKVVARKYGIEVHEKELTEEEVIRNNNRESMFILNSWAADYFAKYLHENEEEGVPVGLSYFRQKRGFSMETIKKFGLGMCPGRSSKMTTDALKAGYKEEFLLSTGLSIKREEDGSLFDRFRERLIFPVHNISGRVVAFGGRTMRTDKSVAKYQNSPESEIYSKKNELYGLFFAKKAIQQSDYVIMVEGYADVISMHQSGIENVVASSGTSLTVEQVRLLRRFTKNITFIYDGDAAGQKAALRGVDIVLTEGMDVRVVLLPEGEDPDTFARSRGVTELQEYIAANAENFITFKAKLLLRDAASDPIKRSAVVNDMVQSIALIPDDIKRSLFVKECSRLMDVDENLLISQVASRRLTKAGVKEGAEYVQRQARYLREQQPYATTSEVSQRIGKNPVGSSVETLEADIIGFLVKYGDKDYTVNTIEGSVQINVAAEIVTQLDNDAITLQNGVYQRILDIYRLALQENRQPDKSELVNCEDVAVCRCVVNMLTMDDNYVESRLWQQKDVQVTALSEVLAAGVPKVLLLYKSKIVVGRIEEIEAALHDESITDEQQAELLQYLCELNTLKVALSQQLRRMSL